MAGHSKWANIKHRKGAQDAKRGKIFTRLNKEITIAVKEKGPDPDSNPRLRLAIQNAKGANMPKDNIERAIKKASGADGATYQEITYEGYASNGVAVFVECSTDNTNRTVASVRSSFNKYGAGLGKNGSLEFIFDRKGIFIVEKTEGIDMDELEMELIDAGAEDIEFDEELSLINITTAMEDFGSLIKKLDEMEIAPTSAELQRIPKTTVELGDDDFKKVMKLINALEDNDDVQKVYHSLEIKESQFDLM